MIAESSPPPQALPVLPPAAGRKRKRAGAPASSPAPSDSPANGSPAAPEVITSRADLASRPRLSISRGPIFIPLQDGSDFYKTDMVGVNRLGFRYIPAGLTPAGSAVPCRTIESNPTSYRVSWEDRSPFINVTKDGLRLLGSKGFRSARCNAPIREGKWYMEIEILKGGGDSSPEDTHREGSHVRLGWGRREAPLNGPVGLDGYSYGYRDKTGEKVTLSRPKPYGQPFSSGDVVGMYISLPPRRQPSPNDPHDPANIRRERIAIDLKGQETFEMLEYNQSKEMIALMEYATKSSTSASLPSSASKKPAAKAPDARLNGRSTASDLRPLPTLPDSHIAFFVNGQCQGLAFSDIYDYLQLRTSETSRKGKEKKKHREGVKEHRENPFDDGHLGYYPLISLFNHASVQLNPGPDFRYPPPPDIDSLLRDDKANLTDSSKQSWRPICERYHEFMQEQWELDQIEEEEAKLELERLEANKQLELDRQVQKAKKREQAEARKRIKLGITELNGEGDRSNLLQGSIGYGQPSPLRQSTAYEADRIADFQSPAPTFASFGEAAEPTSGYNSDNGEPDLEENQEVEDEESDAAPIVYRFASPWTPAESKAASESVAAFHEAKAGEQS